MARRACSTKDVNVARDQTARMLKDAEKLISKGSTCAVRLQSAKIAFDAAKKASGSVIERRDAYVRAAFQAGQAHACAVVTTITPMPTRRGARKPRAKKASLKGALGMKDDQGFDLAEVRRIANLINYGVPVEEIRTKVPEMSDGEFFLAYKAAERYLKQDQDR